MCQHCVCLIIAIRFLKVPLLVQLLKHCQSFLQTPIFVIFVLAFHFACPYLQGILKLLKDSFLLDPSLGFFLLALR